LNTQNCETHAKRTNDPDSPGNFRAWVKLKKHPNEVNLWVILTEITLMEGQFLQIFTKKVGKLQLSRKNINKVITLNRLTLKMMYFWSNCSFYPIILVCFDERQ